MSERKADSAAVTTRFRQKCVSEHLSTFITGVHLGALPSPEGPVRSLVVMLEPEAPVSLEVAFPAVFDSYPVKVRRRGRVLAQV